VKPVELVPIVVGGDSGAPRSVRRYVVELRPRPRREIYLRTEPLIGEPASAAAVLWVPPHRPALRTRLSGSAIHGAERNESRP
jgi:hypothetical protein